MEIVKPVAQSYLASLWDNEAFRKTRDNDLDSQTNRFSRWFTKLVAGVALGAAVFWLFRDAGRALKVFTSVFIVACPCALALAAPLTHGTVQRLLARLKIFLRNALVIERMAAVDTIVLDKTGTLTAPDARGVHFQGRELSAEERAEIASVVRHSTHPNSVRIAKLLGPGSRTVTGFVETPGCGVEARVDGQTIVLGSPIWVATLCDAPDGTHDETPAGASVLVAVNGRLRGVFMLENSLRPEVENLITRLGNRYELVLLSGDNEREAARFGKIFGGRADAKIQPKPGGQIAVHPATPGARAQGDDGGRRLERRGRAATGGRGRGGGGTSRHVFPGERRDFGRGGTAAAGARAGILPQRVARGPRGLRHFGHLQPDRREHCGGGAVAADGVRDPDAPQLRHRGFLCVRRHRLDGTAHGVDAATVPAGNLKKNMNHSEIPEIAAWRQLANSPTVREQQVAFTCATGVPLTLSPASAHALAEGTFCVKGCLGGHSGEACRHKLLRRKSVR